MKVRLSEGQEFRTELPVAGFITEADKKPVIKVVGLGSVEAKPYKDGWRFEFHVMQAGEYQLTVSDQDETWDQVLTFGQQRY